MPARQKMQKVLSGVVAENRRARFDYEILDTFEAGLVLKGTEVKSLRNGKVQISESYATPENGEIWLVNAHVPEYLQANRFNHDERRPRKLLLSRREINRLTGSVEKQGHTIVPLKMYFNDRGKAKVLVGLAKGKQNHDKRRQERDRDWARQKSRLMKDHG